MKIDRRRLVDTLAALVRIPSVNPAFTAGTTDERGVADYVLGELAALGAETFRYEAVPGRVSAVGRLAGRGAGPSLMLYAHHDTVGVEGMKEPFSARTEGGRLFGRGAYDMKSGLAACLAALRALAGSDDRPGGDVFLVSVADEEEGSLGMEEVLRHHRTDAAIVTEPTELAVCSAHKGFAWVEIVTRGRAAHGSRPDLGVDANLAMGQVLAGVARLEETLRKADPHPLLGPPSLHVGTLHGGAAPSVYAAACRAVVERRTLPGEDPAAAVAEIGALVERIGHASGISASVHPLLWRDAFEVTTGSPIGHAVRAARRRVLGSPGQASGVSFWTDAALLAREGVDTVVFGPAGEGAHADVEWVDLDSVVAVAQVLAAAAAEYCGWGGGGGSARVDAATPGS
jgi:acetylornithine deacetylase